MTANLGGVTPLMVPRTNAEWQPVGNHNNNANYRRRTNTNNGFQNHDVDDFTNAYHHHHHPLDQQQQEQNSATTTTTTSDDGNGSYDNCKKGFWSYGTAQSYWARLQMAVTNLAPIVRGKFRARTADCTTMEHTQTHSRHNHTLNTSCSVGGASLDPSYYFDTYNDESWACTFGTREEDGIWLNVHDRVGTIMSSTVWILVLYSGVTVGLLSQHNHLSPLLAKIYFTMCALALASHVKTTFTDPGAIPHSAVPVDVYTPAAHAMCSRCQSYKPPGTHHCRICDRCISGMDHHCPWMNNCVGTGNMKHFVLFLCYTWTASAFALIMFGWNYFFCADEECTLSIVLVQLVRVMTLLCTATLVFVSSMLSNVTFGVMTGIGTIDRLKMKADNTWGLADDEPMELREIFGVGDYWTWAFPFFDPVFEDYDIAMGYSTPQRLLRERV